MHLGFSIMRIMQTSLDLSVGKLCCSRHNDGTWIFGRIEAQYFAFSNLRKIIVVRWDDRTCKSLYIESFRTYFGKVSDLANFEQQVVYIISEKDKLALQIKLS
jgi:hypothetical protein